MKALVGQLFSSESKHTEERAALPRTDAARLATVPKKESLPLAHCLPSWGRGRRFLPHTHFIKQEDFVDFALVRAEDFQHHPAGIVEDRAEMHCAGICSKVQLDKEDGDRP